MAPRSGNFCAYLAALGLEILAHSVRSVVAINGLDNQADIRMVQKWLGRAIISTTRIYHLCGTRPEHSATFKVPY